MACCSTQIEELRDKMRSYQQWETGKKITWCGGCGNYSIQNAMKRALTLENLGRRDVVICYDVGCSGNGSDKIEAYTIHGLHGRVLPLAAGAAIGNRDIKVIATAGDGATFSEGVNHLVHAVRNDYPVVFIFHNNENYGLTTGQPSALTKKGVKMNSAPDGVAFDALNAADFVLSLKPSFVARSYSGDVDHMTDIFRAGIKHKGFSFIEVFQACPTYNRETPDDWYAERVRYVEELKDYDETDIWQARKLVEDLEKDIYLGIVYRNPKKQNFWEASGL
ncbi:2-oxoacid ferredoxin oxidoreductase [Candidatus Peregrinibacteria bacterium HGW-Peregrinibacteria-1]|jgi:2-oxoglutarate ferredoxin oxidoreductase subunit beta|nr:MAG: 2-oxoacid ferredoxin oxidoreductase [Candidatus Peregrinibacteria bacterium HGW-Peregrinibacteria-1]